jgi:hypothetical protein
VDRFAEFVERIVPGLTLHLHARWGGVWESRTVPVVSVLEAERELAHWHRDCESVSAVLMDHGQRVAEWGGR